jgi:hypothetical protein
VLRGGMFGLLTRLCYATFDNRRYGQHHDQYPSTVDINIDSDDTDDVDIDCAQSGRLQRHAPAQ